jgi:hypothetical protein
MKLSTFLEETKLSYTEFAKRIGTKHPRTVERYAKGQRFPRGDALAAIRRETEGKVTADDFVAEAAE